MMAHRLDRHFDGQCNIVVRSKTRRRKRVYERHVLYIIISRKLSIQHHIRIHDGSYQCNRSYQCHIHTIAIDVASFTSAANTSWRFAVSHHKCHSTPNKFRPNAHEPSRHVNRSTYHRIFPTRHCTAPGNMATTNIAAVPFANCTLACVHWRTPYISRSGRLTRNAPINSYRTVTSSANSTPASPSV